MKRELKCILLVDDDQYDNFFHEREIKKNHSELKVISLDMATDAIDYLRAHTTDDFVKPDLIFLDINMPCMNGWEFLELFVQLDESVKLNTKIVMLSTSNYVMDLERAKKFDFVSDYCTKPLTTEVLEEVIKKHFY